MCMSKWPLKEQKLLDVGCGTGTFLQAVQGKLGSLHGIEYNDGMLSQARQRLGASVNLTQGSADSMPFEKGSFDVVAINQVIHHFPTENNYLFFKKFLQEAFRVLKPGGCLILNTSTPNQQRDAFWWLALFPEASDTICNRFPPLNLVHAYMREVGFLVDADSVTVPLQRTLMAEDKYLEYGIEGAFKAEYRCGDSSWSMAENCGELAKGQQRIRDMQRDGTAEAWLAEREKLRMRVGQATFIARVPNLTQ